MSVSGDCYICFTCYHDAEVIFQIRRSWSWWSGSWENPPFKPWTESSLRELTLLDSSRCRSLKSYLTPWTLPHIWIWKTNTMCHALVNYKENLYFINKFFMVCCFQSPWVNTLWNCLLPQLQLQVFWGLPLLAVHIYRWNFLPIQLKPTPISWRAFVNSDWAILTHEYISIVAKATMEMYSLMFRVIVLLEGKSLPQSPGFCGVQQASFPDCPEFGCIYLPWGREEPRTWFLPVGVVCSEWWAVLVFWPKMAVGF